MTRRLWMIEGFASDGDVYGRALRLPGRGDAVPAAPLADATERTQASVLKRHTADLASCPCFSAMQPDDLAERQGDAAS